MADTSGQTDRNKIETRWHQLRTDRSSWFSHWQEISTYLLPRNGRFFTTERDRGRKKHNNIYDSTAIRANRTLAAGMMSGMTSPARPWFRLATPDQELNDSAAVKRWLSDVRNTLLAIIGRSNSYNALHSMYAELGGFGTACTLVLEDFDNVIHHYTLTIGEYCLGTDYKGRVNTLYREFEKSVGQLVEEFGIEQVSQQTASLYRSNSLDQMVGVIHSIEPRRDRDPSKRDAKNMPWRSVYIERGARDGEYLRDSGFRDFRVLAPRWDLVNGDTYGSSPGMEALGDIKQLQHEQKRKGQAIDFQSNPPLQAPSSLAGSGVNRLPGGTSYYDGPQGNTGIRNAFEVNLRLDYLLEDIRDVRERINSTFYADLFLMLANQPLSGSTATEIAERHEEKLLMLGPVLERLHNELLSPKVDLVFSDALRAGILPPPPPELQGREIRVEFVSVLAQAQRAVSNNSIDRYVATLGTVAGFKPSVLDKFDSDRWADLYADQLGVDPDLIVPSQQVALIRNRREEEAQRQQQADQLEQSAKTAKDLAAANTSGDNLLSSPIDQFSGYR